MWQAENGRHEHNLAQEAQWLVIGNGGRIYGSFSDKDRADEYAGAIAYHRRIPCKIVENPDFCVELE
jgi:hypothetical protein